MKFSKPKIYNAGGDISKRWYVYFSYRNPKTGKLERQPPIYLDINRVKDFKERTKLINILRNDVEELLQNGHIPTAYQEDTYSEENKISINKAIDLALKNAKATMKATSFKDYNFRLKKFEKWLTDNQFYGREIQSITKKTITNYLNHILEQTSPKNRNNTRANLSIFFSFLEQNDYIKDNFVKIIPVIQAKAQRNKTYSPQQEEKIYDLLQVEDPHLYLFIKFVSYNFLRPIEVCRLRVKDIDFQNAKLFVDAKNQAGKTKIIPQILMKDILQYQDFNPDFYLFSSSGVGCSNVSEMQRRDYWTKRFKKVKDKLNLDKDYTIYSFRHTFITKLYRELRREFPPYETKTRLMLITGHQTMQALEKYLRDIDAELPEDYSHLLA